MKVSTSLRTYQEDRNSGPISSNGVHSQATPRSCWCSSSGTTFGGSLFWSYSKNSHIWGVSPRVFSMRQERQLIDFHPLAFRRDPKTRQPTGSGKLLSLIPALANSSLPCSPSTPFPLSQDFQWKLLGTQDPIQLLEHNTILVTFLFTETKY